MVSEPRASFYGREIGRLAHEAGKPVVVTWAGPLSMARQGYPMLGAAHVPVFDSVRGAVRALRAVEQFGRFQKALAEGATS
jgi:acyl-CoA synthetase (NDP forming)